MRTKLVSSTLTVVANLTREQATALSYLNPIEELDDR